MKLYEGYIYIGAFKMSVKYSIYYSLRSRLQKKVRAGQKSKSLTWSSVFSVDEHHLGLGYSSVGISVLDENVIQNDSQHAYQCVYQ